MKNKSALDPEYDEFVKNNPNKKFILYLRRHPLDEREKILLTELEKVYGEYKEVPKDRLAIFIVVGCRVQGFINKLNAADADIYLSFIQSEDELNDSKG